VDFEDHGFSGLTPYYGENQSATTFEGFLPLLDRENDLIESIDRTFTKPVIKGDVGLLLYVGLLLC
jgi:hypothetical protein